MSYKCALFPEYYNNDHIKDDAVEHVPCMAELGIFIQRSSPKTCREETRWERCTQMAESYKKGLKDVQNNCVN